MKHRSSWILAGLVTLSATVAFTRDASSTPAPTLAPGQSAQEHGMPELPPGWTAADMQACMAAGTPGAMHEHLGRSIGEWKGKNTMWMAPGAEPQVTECTSTVTAMMDGRYIKTEISGEMPGMGPYSGFGLYGYDNVAEQFQSTWIDNCGTGMMVGTGELSADGKTLTWNYQYHCPLNKDLATLREIERETGKDTRTLEMFGTDPKSGKEFKMMQIEFKRVGSSAMPASAGR